MDETAALEEQSAPTLLGSASFPGYVTPLNCKRRICPYPRIVQACPTPGTSARRYHDGRASFVWRAIAVCFLHILFPNPWTRTSCSYPCFVSDPGRFAGSVPRLSLAALIKPLRRHRPALFPG